ncbi:LamG domain-containing protein [Streptomyces hoynatensis]|uniref:LamG domain-containing protein n=2 Tax=Streptomyces hoynatensis TaxID=1141874 RepID=A0A3A9ZD40_9ACTN|nr:LamG domain-containing protein [Streptomyces hoynatensis]
MAGAGPGALPAAQALTPPVTMTAEDLPTWQTNGIVFALAEADGVVFAGGTFSAVRPPGAEPGTQERAAGNFVALDAATGEPATGCDLSFTIGSGTAMVRALAVSPDHRTLYAAGSFGSVNGAGASSVAAFALPGCTRIPFPVAANGIVRGLAATADRVYLAGDFTQLNGRAHARFGAVTTAGAVDGNWVADADEIGKAVAVTPDGAHVLLGGDFFRVNGAASHALAVVDAGTGDNVRTYPEGFIERNSTVQVITTDDTGFYVGAEGTGGGVFDGRIALDLDTLDERWRDTCLGATQALAVHGEVLYSGHHAHDCSSMGEFPNQERYHLLAQSVNDPGKLGWFPNTNDGLGEALGPRVLATATDVPGDSRDYLWVGGGFTVVDGTAQWGLTRFATGPDTGAPPTPEAHAAAGPGGGIDLSWAPSSDLDDSLLTYRVYRDGGTSPVHTVQAESLPWSRPQLTWNDAAAAGESHSYRISATDGAGNTSALSAPVTATAAAGGGEPYRDAVLADHPALYWRLDETAGTFASDQSGNGNNGFHRGGPQRGVTPAAVPGPQAASAGYDGTDSFTYSDRLFSGQQRFTLETWFRTTTTRGGKLMGLGNLTVGGPSTSQDDVLYMLDDGRLRFGCVISGGSRVLTTSRSYNDGRWHQVAASIGARGMELYVDGVRTNVNSVFTSARNTSGYWHVGGDSLANWANRPSSDYFAGQLDETAVYPAQLTAARVAAHHDAASLPADSVTALEPTADAYVNGAARGANYGPDQQLAVRGTSAYESYLRFGLPNAPAGQVLKNATLRVRVSDDSASGSADSFAVRPVTGDWQETAVTYDTRPTLGDTALGTLEAPATPGGVYAAPLDPATVRAALGGELDLALTGTGGDSLWFWSREARQTSYHPQLLLTFGAP